MRESINRYISIVVADDATCVKLPDLIEFVTSLGVRSLRSFAVNRECVERIVVSYDCISSVLFYRHNVIKCVLCVINIANTAQS